MSEQLWLGALIAAVIGTIGWAFRQIFLNFRSLKAENTRLKDERLEDSRIHFERSSKQTLEKLEKIELKMGQNEADLGKEIQRNIMSITKLEIEMKNFSDVLIVVRDMAKDISRMKGFLKIKSKGAF